MAKPNIIETPTGELIPILYEDRSVLAIDKPAGWMLAPEKWQKTSRNLQAFLRASLEARDFWARSRNLKYIRYIHRLDAETTGVLLLGKSAGAVSKLASLFETRQVDKAYLAVVHGVPSRKEWSCCLRIGPSPNDPGRMRTDPGGKSAETRFRVLKADQGMALVLARPATGRTHQIRVHLQSSGYPVVGDPLYGPSLQGRGFSPMALRAVRLSYVDPFTRQPIRIEADFEQFCLKYRFDSAGVREEIFGARHRPERPERSRAEKPNGPNRTRGTEC